MARSEAITLKLLADVSQYTAGLEETGRFTRREIASMAKDFARHQQKMAASAERAAKQTGQSWSTALKHAVAQKAVNILSDLGRGFIELVADVEHTRRELVRFADETQVSVEVLDAVRLAATKGGAEFEGIADSFRDFGEKMFDFANGGGAAEEAFRALGVQVRNGDGSLRSVDGTLREVIGKLQDMEDETLQAALAQQLFSDQGAELLRVLGDQSLDEYLRFAQQFGLVQGPAAAQASRDWDQALGGLSIALQSVAGDLVQSFGTTATQLVQDFTLGLVASWQFVKTLVSSMGDYRLAVETARKSAQLWHATWRKAADDATQRISGSGGFTRSIEEAAGATRQLGDIAFQAWTKYSDPFEVIDANYQRLLDRIDELELKSGDHHAAEEARKNARLAWMGEVQDEHFKQLRAQNKINKKLLEDEQRNRDAMIDTALQFSGVIQGVFGDYMQQYASMGEEGKRQARKLFAVNKALALAEIVVNTARAIMTALASYGPAGPAMAAMVGGMGITQAAIVANEQPRFHGGRFGMGINSDESPAILHRREVVIPPAMVDANGGPQGVQQRLEGQPQPQTLRAVFDLGGEFVEAVGRIVGARNGHSEFLGWHGAH